MFASSYDLQRHTKVVCPMEEIETDANSEADDKDDDSGFTLLVNQVLEENKYLFEWKLDQFMEENSQLIRQEAREDLKDMMLLRDRAFFFRKFKHILVIISNSIQAWVIYIIVSKKQFQP